MYSRLNKLEEQLNDVCSATQGAIISKQIEKEKQLIQAEKYRQEKQMDELVSGAKASIDQISILQDNYDTLKELYDIQVESNKEAKKEIARNHKISMISIIIAILSFLVAVASFVADICRWI